MKERSFEYRIQNRWIFFILVLMFWMFFKLSLSRAGDPFYHFRYKRHYLEHVPSQYLMYAFAAFSLAMLVFGLYVIVFSFIKREIKITEVGIEAPESILNPFSHNFKYADISNYEVKTTKKGEILIVYSGNRKMKISESCFPSSEDYMFVYKSVSRKKFVG